MTTPSPRPPGFISIGAQKCATTWLYNCLKEHPEVFLGPKNRICYFENPYHQDHDWDWYLSHFAGAAPGQAIGEARVEYVYNPETPELLARHLPDCKLILMLRNPVERAVSAYLWNVRKGVFPDLPLDEGIRLAFFEDHSAFDPPRAELLRRIVGMGRYAEQIERYLRHFQLSQFLILLHDNIKTDPAANIRAAYRFIGVNESFSPAGLESRPLRSAGIPLLTRLERGTRFIYGSGKVWEWANRTANRAGWGRARPKLGSKLQRAVAEFYAPQNRKLRGILERWRTDPQVEADHLKPAQCGWLEEARDTEAATAKPEARD